MLVAAKHSERGLALAETMLMLSFIMLLLFSLVQTGMASYYQVSADGATFMGSHAATVNDPTGSGTGASVAQSVAQNIFQGIGKASVTLLHPSNTTTETDISFAGGGLGLGAQPATTSREIETSADSGTTSATGTLPPNNTALCIANGLNSVTGQVTTMKIGDFTPGSLETSTVSAANSLAGSLSITNGTITATYGTIQPALGAVNAASASLAATLTAINSDVVAIQQAPVLGTTVASLVTGTTLSPAVNALSPLVPVTTGANTTVASTLSGANGAVSQAAEGVLSSSEANQLANVIGHATVLGTQTGTGVLGVLSTLNASNLGGNLTDLENQLSNLPGKVNALNTAETALNTADTIAAGVASPACPGS